ncbi:hypothetical protein HU200_049693 [Digitaria exilis]|uniref:Uncharacterized protein n=1 Tax=Digitaria exilis TaxID=1010633 RepID=A0A835ATP6_9POAL|nr:hypothetical protein HU200_049693 [Digitaria exilis]
MHEYSLHHVPGRPRRVAAALSVYRTRFSGHGKNAQKRKRDEIDWGSGEEGEVYDGAARAASRPAVTQDEDDAMFVGDTARVLHFSSSFGGDG